MVQTTVPPLSGAVVVLITSVSSDDASRRTPYRFLDDYLLNPPVMKHTVKVIPGLTIGGSLLGVIGALIAFPIAATIHLLLQEVVFSSPEPEMTARKSGFGLRPGEDIRGHKTCATTWERTGR
jgi:hypothetical protein